jgi:hypothetical protein
MVHAEQLMSAVASKQALRSEHTEQTASYGDLIMLKVFIDFLCAMQSCCNISYCVPLGTK